MRTFTLIITVMVSLVAMPAIAINFEDDAIIDLGFLDEDTRDTLAAAGLFNQLALPAIREKGWKCTSISFFHWMSNDPFKMKVTCSQNRYTYEMIDRGGNWEVELK